MSIHYNYVYDKLTDSFVFTTKNNILYRILFVSDETFSTISGEEIPNVFQLIVEKTSDELESFDSKVFKTIEDIVERFFQKIENSLIYICSDENDKAEARHRIFDRWYKNSRYKEIIVKIDNIMNFNIGESGIQKLYTSFMFHKQNSNYEKLIDIYNQIEKVINEEK